MDADGAVNFSAFPDGEAPSRFELLSMVKKHSKLLEKSVINIEDISDVETNSLFWKDILDLYFIRGRESKDRQDDDLIFFVRGKNLDGYGFNDNMGTIPPYFVRSVQALKKYQNDVNTPLSPIFKVVKTVYASPSCVDFQLDSRKVLTEQDHCYCVLLNAHEGAAFPSLKAQLMASTSGSDTNSGRSKLSKLTLFSGFVSYQMVREAYDAGRSRFGSLLNIGHHHTKTDRLYMRGPGGRGEVEVAVSAVADQSKEDLGPFSPILISKRGFGIGLGTIVRKAASAASEAAKHAYSGAWGSDSELVPLKCCLMSISLPWELIAHDLLFKGTQPVDL